MPDQIVTSAATARSLVEERAGDGDVRTKNDQGQGDELNGRLPLTEHRRLDTLRRTLEWARAEGLLRNY